MREMISRLLLRDALAHSVEIFKMNYYNKLHCNLFDGDGKMNPFWLRAEYARSNNNEEFSKDTIVQIPIFLKLSNFQANGRRLFENSKALSGS